MEQNLITIRMYKVQYRNREKNLRAIAPTISEWPHESVVYYMNDIDESELNPVML